MSKIRSISVSKTLDAKLIAIMEETGLSASAVINKLLAQYEQPSRAMEWRPSATDKATVIKDARAAIEKEQIFKKDGWQERIKLISEKAEQYGVKVA